MSVTLAAIAFAAIALVPAAKAAIGPVADVKTTWADTNLPPGGKAVFALRVRSLGDQDLSQPLVLTDQLPAGVTATEIRWATIKAPVDVAPTPQVPHPTAAVNLADFCEGEGTGLVRCELPMQVPAEYEGSPVTAEVLSSLGKAPGTKAQGEGPTQLAGFSPEPTGWLPEVHIDVEVAADATGTATNTATVEGGGTSQPRSDVDVVNFSPADAGFGLAPGGFSADVFDAAYPFGQPSRQAGGRPFEQRVGIDLNAHLISSTTTTGVSLGNDIQVNGLVRTVQTTLPRGMIGNPEALPKCDQRRFAEVGASANSTACPANTQVGYLSVLIGSGGDGNLSKVPIYNLAPPFGTPVDLGFLAGGFVQGHIYAELDPSQGYAIKAVTSDIAQIVRVLGSEVTLWGVPGDPAHDRFRFYSKKQESGELTGAPFAGPIRPFFTNPMDCGFDNGGARIRVDSYSNPGHYTPEEEDAHPLNVSGCDDPRFRFKPEVSLQPTDAHAGAPTGLDVHLKVPQQNDEVDDADDLYTGNGDIKAIATPPIKKAVVTLPEGMTLSPSAAQGLGSCSAAQIGLNTNQPVTCPDNSQYGTLTLHTPILPQDAQPKGFIYIAKQGDSPFHNFLSLYLVIEEPERGILVKIPGRLDLNPNTGQITTTFDELPQFPVSDMQMTFKGGARAGLVNPSTCGQKTIRAEFFSWHDPATPRVVDSSYAVTQKPDGSPCVNSLDQRQFKPEMETGTTSNSAGSFSPFTFRLTRTDDDQEFSQIGVILPQGLAAKFAGVSICSDAGILRAERRTGAGEGFLEQANPSCPVSSQIGTTEVGAGVGVPLSYVPGKVYLAGPYRGAPLSIVVISPAIVGPFDLGVIAVRTAVNINPETAQAVATSDPFPQIYQGIPVRIRDIRLKLDRQNFTVNPTSCIPKQITAHVTGTGGNVASTADDTGADLSNRFQAADCASLGFKPRLSFRLFGGTKRGAHPRFKAVLRGRPGDANLARASVALPPSEFLDQAHIKTVCTRVQFAAQACPTGSIYGYATATTPLFDQPLRGPVYLRSSKNLLPDLVVTLKGPDSQPIEVEVAGRVDSIHGGIRNTFELIPDAPVTSFTLTMQGGKKGLLVNSADLCAEANRATAKFTAQNGKALTLHPVMQSACGKKTKGKKGAQRPGRRSG